MQRNEYEHIGHVLWFCEICRQARSFRVERIWLLRRSRLKRIRIDYGRAVCCSACGFKEPLREEGIEIHPEQQSVENAEQVFASMYGEDDWRSRRIQSEANFEVGLSNATTRGNMIAWAMTAVTDEIQLPGLHRLQAKGGGERLIQYLIGVVAMLIIWTTPTSLLLKNYAEGSSESGMIALVGFGGLAISFLAWSGYHGMGLRQDFRIRQAKKVVQARSKDRIAMCLGPVRPTGTELQEYLVYARQRGLISGTLDSESVLEYIHERSQRR